MPTEAQGEIDKYIEAMRIKRASNSPALGDAASKGGKTSRHFSIATMNAFLKTAPFNEKFQHKINAGYSPIVTLLQAADRIPDTGLRKEIRAPSYGSTGVMNAGSKTFERYTEVVRKAFAEQLAVKGEEATEWISKFDAQWQAIADEKVAYKNSNRSKGK
jgi:hypothetical protein